MIYTKLESDLPCRFALFLKLQGPFLYRITGIFNTQIDKDLKKDPARRDEIIGICKIASVFYQYEPLKKEQFTFRKVITNLGGAKEAVATPPEPVKI